MSTNLTDIAARTLGSANSYAVYTTQFDASLLNPMPRAEGRKDWNIKGDEFSGYDVWHCHEATFLLESGAPVAGTLKIRYDASSEFMVESKSAKLYLNSFDMCKMGQTLEAAIENYEHQIATDLTNALGVKVETKFFESGNNYRDPISVDGGYVDLHQLLADDLQDIRFTDFEGKQNHIGTTDVPGLTKTRKYYTNVLRSRCRHTKQKDTGAALIELVLHNVDVDPASVLKQIVSMREVAEFHELCAEHLICSLRKIPGIIGANVTLMYSRRGSLDICPTRSFGLTVDTTPEYPRSLVTMEILTPKEQGQ